MTASTNDKNMVDRGSYASVNGLEMYYEIHGTGEPILLLPGGMMTIEMMGPVLASLAETRQVIAVELQGHGHTADIDRPLTYEQLADDTASLIQSLRLVRANIFGFSMGGGVALQTAIRHPDVVRKLVLVSTICKSDGEYPEIRTFLASFDAGANALSAHREAYVRVAPNPQDWPTFVAKIQAAAALNYDWTEQVAAIQAPTLIVVGDADTVRPAHAVEMFGMLGGGKADSAMGNLSKVQLAVLPGTTEFGMLARVDLLAPVMAPFLDTLTPIDN